MQRRSRDKLGARSGKRCSRVPASKLGPLPPFHDRIRESYVDFRAVERYNRSKKVTGPFFELGEEKSQVRECLPTYHYISQVKLPGKPLPTPVCPQVAPRLLLGTLQNRPADQGLSDRGMHRRN